MSPQILHPFALRQHNIILNLLYSTTYVTSRHTPTQVVTSRNNQARRRLVCQNSYFNGGGFPSDLARVRTSLAGLDFPARATSSAPCASIHAVSRVSASSSIQRSTSMRSSLRVIDARFDWASRRLRRDVSEHSSRYSTGGCTEPPSAGNCQRVITINILVKRVHVLPLP